jgi:putative acetyltransferase
LTRAAFDRAAHSNQTEAKIVDILRADGALSLSLVATEAGHVLGHAAFSPVTFEGSAGGWYGLGPVSVWPSRQRRGVGQALIRDGLRSLQAMPAAGCAVLGEPGYYGRFRFENDRALFYGDAAPGYFQRLVLNGPAAEGRGPLPSGVRRSIESFEVLLDDPGPRTR